MVNMDQEGRYAPFLNMFSCFYGLFCSPKRKALFNYLFLMRKYLKRINLKKNMLMRPLAGQISSVK